jgi:hypothetical protein
VEISFFNLKYEKASTLKIHWLYGNTYALNIFMLNIIQNQILVDEMNNPNYILRTVTYMPGIFL